MSPDQQSVAAIQALIEWIALLVSWTGLLVLGGFGVWLARAVMRLWRGW